MSNNELIEWLLNGDVSIGYQTNRDLLSNDNKQLQQQIASEGWGKQFLSKQNENGHWGQKFYKHKWISSHYTLLDLRNLNLSPETQQVQAIIKTILDEEKGRDGGMLPHGKLQLSDACVSGMVLNYASYFQAEQEQLKSIVDFLLAEKLDDGGFNCMANRNTVTHSSLHSTLSICEGIAEYIKNGYSYRAHELLKAKESSIEFILLHRLFLSDKTGEIIQKEFLRLRYPARWKYNILRAMDFLRYDGAKWDERMSPAINVILQKRKKDGRWNAQAKHPGQVHFEMEKAGTAGRWNTLLALRVLKHFGIVKLG